MKLSKKHGDHRMNRKGMADDVQIGILAIMALLIFSFFLYHQYTVLKEKMALQSCKDSIQAHSFIAMASGRHVLTDIKCPTSEITIRDLKKAKATIAEDMHRCWYIWDRGKGKYFEDNGNYCFICSIYQFGDKKQTVKDFGQYISDNYIQVRYIGDTQGTKYEEYFQGYVSSASTGLKPIQIYPIVKDDSLNTSLRYATIFVYASGEDAIQQYDIDKKTAGMKDLEQASFIAFRQYDAAELKTMGCEKMVVNQRSNAGDAKIGATN